MWQRLKQLYQYITASKKRIVGFVLIFFCTPFVHNLHNILPKSFTTVKMDYYDTRYYFMWLAEHSFAPVVALVGLYLLSDNKSSRAFFSIPIFYFFYKTLEKLPFRDEFDIHQELYLFSIIVFVIGLPLWILAEMLGNFIRKKLRNMRQKYKDL